MNKDIEIKNGDVAGAFKEIAEKSVLNNLPQQTSVEWQEGLKGEINIGLWYALGDITPTEEKMKRAVESVFALFASSQKELVEGIEKWVKTNSFTDADLYVNTNDLLSLLEEYKGKI